MNAATPSATPSDTRTACFDLTGRVLLPEGTPAEGATVYHYRGSASPLETGGIRAKVVTGAEGAFALEDVPYDHMESLGDRVIALLPGFGLTYWLAGWEREDGRPVVLRLNDGELRVRAFSPLAPNGCHFELPASPGATDVDFVIKPRRWRVWRRLLRTLRCKLGLPVPAR